MRGLNSSIVRVRATRSLIPVLSIGVCLFAGTEAPAGSMSSFSDAVLAANPVSYWRLGDLAGNVAVDETGVSHGQYNNGPLLNQPGSVVGDPDASVYFDGRNDFASFANSDQYLIDDGTIMFCFQDRNAVHDTGLWSKDSVNKGTGGHLTFETRATGSVSVRLQDTQNDYFVESSPFIQLDQWYHVALTFGSQGMRLYIDGELVDTNPYTGGLGASSGGIGNFEPIVLGASAIHRQPDGGFFPLTGFFSGLIDEVAIFDRALPQTEIQHLITLKSIPEPATIGLLAFGGLIALRRRRR